MSERPVIVFTDSYGNILAEHPALGSKFGPGGHIPKRATFVAFKRSPASTCSRMIELIDAARSLHAGLTCEHDPMDVDERIERLGAALEATPLEQTA